MKKKIIPLFWAVFMIMLLIPANILVFAQGEDTTAPEIESAIGKVVQMNESSLGSAYFYGTVTETTANGGSFRYYDNPNAVPSCFIVVDVVYNRNYDQYYYKLATVDGSTNEQLQKTPWLKAILCTVIGDAPQMLVGATANFKTATTIFYENVTESGASGSFGVASLPEKVVIIAEQTVNGEKYYQVALSDGSSDENFDKLPWIKASDVNIIDMPSEEGVIEGQVTVVQNGNTANEIMLAPGEKQYVFTEFGAAVSDVAQYQWQMKVVGNGWADVKDYVYPYAIISDALIQNALDADGKAYVRCMVTDGDKRFVTPEMAVTLTSNAVSVNGYVSSAKSVTARSISDMQNRAGDDLSGAFHITIQYKFLHDNAVDTALNDSTAANTFTITLGSGMSFSESIVSPPVLGYKPYVDYESGNDEGKITYAGHTLIPADEVKFNNQSDPIDVIVYYVPQNVTFRVKHFKQNLQDDEYTEWKTEFRQGLSDTAVNENLEQDEESLALSEVGFSALYYDKDTIITNDGNTVVEIYYDRIYYLVKYELGGGYGVMPNYVRYGTSVMLGTPTRPGYTFDSWKLTSVKDTTDGEELLTDANLTSTYQGYNVTAANSQVTVGHNLVYTAQWTKQTVKYTIIYWLENTDSTDASKKENYSIWHMVEETGSVGNNTIAGSDNIKNNLTGSSLTAVEQDYYFISYNAGLTDTTAKQIAGDGTTTVNIYYSRNEYTLRFYYALYNDNKWYVAGMTDYFGGKANNTIANENNRHDEKNLLDNLGKWGQVSAQPTLKNDKGYTFGTLTSGSNTYHYLSFKAKYGADIAAKWPIDVFNSVTGNESTPNNSWSGTEVLMSAWTGEWNVKYQHDNTNQTIKGKYEVLDSSLMWRPNEGGWNNATYNDKTISFLSFWENAINETWNHPELYRYKIWLPVMGQESSYPSGTQFVTHNGARYYLADKYDTCDNSSVGEQTQPSLTGYTKNGYVEIPQSSSDSRDIFSLNYGTNNNQSRNTDYITQADYNEIKNNATYKNQYKRAYVVNYFYTRNNNSFIMDDNAGRSTTHTVPYGTSLSSYQVDPTYPSSFEAGNYTFSGWYQDKACTVAFDFGITMPDKNVMAYAKWTPTVWSVTVYMSEEEKDADKTPLLYNDAVDFGSMIAEPDYAAVQQSNPTYKDLIFAGWYYEDGGSEERFDFNTMAIKHDYVIYAKWTSHIPVEYVVRYVAKIDGTETEIAEQTKGVSLAGVSKSFIAKPSSELYDEYRTDKLYLPTVRSQTKEMSTNSSENVITFEYAIPTELRYTIKHTFHSDDAEFVALVGSNTYELSWNYPVQTSGSGVSGTVTVKFDTDLESKVKTDKGAELWEEIVDLSPDFYQKELILTMDSAENVVEFNWEDRGVVFVYQVIHKFQNLDGSYSDTYYDFFGSYGDGDTAVITATPIERVGFEFDDTSEQTKTFSKGSLEPKIIELYYKRQMMSYKVKYVYAPIEETIECEAVPYETVVTAEAKTIDGYAVSGASTQNVSITYDGQIIVFNYVVQQVIYNYQVVGGVGGNVDKVQERINVTATAVGSVPIAWTGYIFAGWYTDEACTQEFEVDISWWQPNAGYRLIPQPTTADANKTYYFYAKFVPTKLVIDNDDSMTLENDNQAFVYKVQYSYGGNNYVIEAVVVGKGKITIVGIPVGATVTVTPIGHWAWRYTSTSDSFSGTISGDPSGITITVTYNAPNDQWLTDVNNAVNAYTST
ncbi:MAG: InlB B-repeat-containing protein [Clostridia bacterium]|nr:InlB B-repeat-containing protein [Clostridia bacterium]